jgi:hypothetical protein
MSSDRGQVLLAENEASLRELHGGLFLKLRVHSQVELLSKLAGHGR